jgi:hypothetical protein
LQREEHEHALLVALGFENGVTPLEGAGINRDPCAGLEVRVPGKHHEAVGIAAILNLLDHAIRDDGKPSASAADETDDAARRANGAPVRLQAVGKMGSRLPQHQSSLPAAQNSRGESSGRQHPRPQKGLRTDGRILVREQARVVP